jgi:hypothetical protein
MYIFFFLDVSPLWARDLNIGEKKGSIKGEKMARRRNKRTATPLEREMENKYGFKV